MTFEEVQKIKALIKRHENLKLMPYHDSRGLLTIGYGRCLARKGISRPEAEVLFSNDYADAFDALHAQFKNDIPEEAARQAVVISMAYQMGTEGLRGFKEFASAIRTDGWHAAADEMLDSSWAKQTPERAEQLADMMRTGMFPDNL